MDADHSVTTTRSQRITKRNKALSLRRQTTRSLSRYSSRCAADPVFSGTKLVHMSEDMSAGTDHSADGILLHTDVCVCFDTHGFVSYP